jgi:hypothetical protein
VHAGGTERAGEEFGERAVVVDDEHPDRRGIGAGTVQLGERQGSPRLQW